MFLLGQQVVLFISNKVEERLGRRAGEKSRSGGREGQHKRREKGAGESRVHHSRLIRALCDPTRSKLGAHPAITLTDSDQPSHCTSPSSLELSCASVSRSAGKSSAPGKLGQSTPCGPGGMTGQSV